MFSKGPCRYLVLYILKPNGIPIYLLKGYMDPLGFRVKGSIYHRVGFLGFERGSQEQVESIPGPWMSLLLGSSC